MPNTMSSIIRSAKRTRDEPLNILTFPTHERYETGLCLTGHNFYAYRAEGIKDWNEQYGKCPPNYTLLDPKLKERQVPRWVEFDLVLSQNKFGQFQLAYPISRKLGVPLISLEHTLPVPQWTTEQRNQLKEMRGNINVFISEYSLDQWWWDCRGDTTIIHHMVDADTFKPNENLSNGRIAHILSVANDWINRDWCKLQGQKILTINGYVPIEKINIGDIVLTDSGHYNTVTKTFKRQYFGDIIKIKLDQNKYYISFTPDHNIRVYRDNQEKYIEANRLRIGDKLKFPKIQQEDYSLLPNVENEDYAYLIGSIIADGSITNKGRIEIFVELSDVKRANKLKNILLKITNSGTITERNSKNGILKIECCSKIFATWLKEKIGSYSKTKSIPNFLFFGHDKIKLKVLQGLWHCDGSFKNGNKGCRLCYSTTSVKLASQVSALLHHFGIKCNINKEKRTTNKSNGKIVPIYRVASQNQDNFIKCKNLINDNCIINEPYSYSITDYQIEQYNGYVYNCEVEKDPSYIVYPGFVAHNCCNFQGWQRITRNLPVIVVGDTPGLSKPAPSIGALVNEYQTSQVFLNTSTISPIPTVVLEAMACGCAVVSTATCMIPEIIEHGHNGFISNDEFELRKYCTELLNNKELAEKLGNNARKTIVEKFSKEQFIQNWNQVFWGVL